MRKSKVYELWAISERSWITHYPSGIPILMIGDLLYKYSKAVRVKVTVEIIPEKKGKKK